MTMEASTPARAATARIVVCSYPRAANVVRAAPSMARRVPADRSEEHTSELQSRSDLVCRLLLEKKKKTDDSLRRSHTTSAELPTQLRQPETELIQPVELSRSLLWAVHLH